VVSPTATAASIPVPPPMKTRLHHRRPAPASAVAAPASGREADATPRGAPAPQRWQVSSTRRLRVRPSADSLSATGRVFAIAAHLQALGGDLVRDQPGDDAVGACRRQRLVVRVGAVAVGVPLHLDGQSGLAASAPRAASSTGSEAAFNVARSWSNRTPCKGARQVAASWLATSSEPGRRRRWRTRWHR